MTVPLTRAKCEADALPGQWWVGLGSIDRPRWLSMRCPMCKRGLSIVRNYENPMGTHTVGDDGAVSPSVICTHAPCTFHDYVHLVGWPP